MSETSFGSLEKMRARFSRNEPRAKKREETFEEQIDRAKRELAEHGITSDQRAAYIPIINAILYKGILPSGYDRMFNNPQKFKYISPFSKMLQILPNLTRGRDERHFTLATPGREDAWRFYLGIPQENDTFGISDYRPSKSTENKYYYKINGFDPEVMFDSWVSIDKQISCGGKKITQDDYYFVMGNFTLGRGQDEKGEYLSYYDRWDLDKIRLERRGIFGKPFEIYDRKYIQNPEIPRVKDTSDRPN